MMATKDAKNTQSEQRISTGVVSAFGIVDQSPLTVSEALRRLNMSHSMTWRDGVRTQVLHVDGLCKEQPTWPVIITGLRTLQNVKAKGNFIYLVLDSRAALSNTNLSNELWPENRKHETFTESLATAMVDSFSNSSQSGWKIETREPTLMDYVNLATKPSQLTNFQTLIFKINPYQLRKEIQVFCISYLAGDVTHRELKAKLGSSLKLTPLWDLMNEGRTQEWRTAVLNLRAGTPMETVLKDTGFQSFELMYIVKSAASSAKALGAPVKTKSDSQRRRRGS